MHGTGHKALNSCEHNNLLKIIAIYAVFSCVWIYLSDETLGIFIKDPVVITKISVFKGFLFVIVTSILLYNLVSRYLFESTYLKDELNKSEQLFNHLSEVIMDAFATVDMSGRILHCNEAFRAMLGYEMEELLSKTYPDITPEKWHSVERKIIEEQVLPRGYSDIYEKEYRKKDGTVFPIEMRTKLVRDNLGKPVIMWAIIRDISERKLAEERLAYKRQQLEELNQTLEKRVEESVHKIRQKDLVLIQQNRLAAMGEMISNIAHQWRQPLNILGLQIQNLKQEYEAGNLDRENIEETFEDSMLLIQHMSLTIDSFRNFFKPDKEKENFKVCQAIANAVQLVKAGFDHKQIKIVLYCNDDADITGYPNEFSQVILNILINARDAFEENKTINPSVTIITGVEEGRVVVTVSDNAGGIPDEIIHKVFDPHFSTKGPQGTGIGLYMSKNIVEKNMNGKLAVWNNEVGAVFRIEI